MPSTITVVGLGYGDPGARTLAAQQALDAASCIVLRTAVHPGIADLIDDPRVVACDDLYESGLTFVDVYAAIVERVLALAAEGDVVYGVPGSPTFGERTARDLTTAAAVLGHQVTFIPAVSGLEAVAQVTQLDLLADQVQLCDAAWISRQVAHEPFAGGTAGVDPTRPLVIGQVYTRAVASEVKHWLFRLYPGDHPVAIIRAAGVPGQHNVVSCAVSELDHHDVDHLSTVVVTPQDELEATASSATLHHIVAHLRSDQGCPWDRQQTHATLRDKVIEEAYEVADAIDGSDPDAVAEELGDLLLLVALHAQIAEEHGDFTIEDVYRQVNAKLVRRHPHVFGDVIAETADDVLTTWRSIKAQEKSVPENVEPVHRYEQLPKSMPVIQRIRLAEEITPIAGSQSFEESGKQMLELVQSMLSDGIDPEAALEWAYRQEMVNRMNGSR